MDEFVSKREERGPLVRPSAAVRGNLRVKSSTVDLAILFYQSKDVGIFPLLVEIFRMLKPGATLVVRKAPMFIAISPDQLVTDQMISDLEPKLLLAGFTEIQRSQSTAPSNTILSGFNAKKPSWKVGPSSLALKKEVKSSPKVQIDVDSDLVDEDSLLTQDLKKLQLPAGDCEIGSTCKNCTCVRAEEEEKVLKFGSTAEQLNNPQSACDSVCILFFFCNTMFVYAFYICSLRAHFCSPSLEQFGVW
ncbi:anamorsin homolog [Lotus japonicus]|uniref:anamorsin homolog n=1 Tax=Lotus japonicus TaxID=34305 RepID=UPI002588504A|nr:anamorsin homolog [Lotus japonicus]